MHKPKLLITGATGFIGQSLVKRLRLDRRHHLSLAVRKKFSDEFADTEVHEIGSISSLTCWAEALYAVDTVIHCAARAHVVSDQSALTTYREVNVDGTMSLATQAAQHGVRRFIFISSIKVNGEITRLGQPFRADSQPAPASPYGISKLEAEQGLLRLAAESDMEVVIIRSPLVYGPGVKGNFASLIQLVEKGIPLPLGAIHNKRSLIGIDNLIDIVIHCLYQPAAANQVLLASDGQDLSTSDLLRALGNAMGKPARIIPVPAGMLQFGAALLGKKAMAQRLLGSLQVDISKTYELLGWTPPYTVEQGLRHCFDLSSRSVAR
jgi:nucleoside-diphosphate-sugar epimerase